MGYRESIPTTDLGIRDWAGNLSSHLSATPQAYFVSTGDATALASNVSDYNTRLTTATHPDTRTKSTIVAKNVSKAALIARCRTLAKQIDANPAITDQQRTDLGIHIRDREPTPAPIPATKPQVSAIPLGGRQIGISLADELTPNSGRKPDTVMGAYLWLALSEPGAPAPAGTDACKFVGMAKRCNHVITQPATAANKVAWIIAQWVNTRGEAGPESPPVSCSIAA